MRTYLRRPWRAVAWLIAACVVLLSGCGIYTAEDALNPPFGISFLSRTELKFTGDNALDFTESLFSGYTLWFKEREDDPYRVIQYNGILSSPTIPITELPPVVLPLGITAVTVPSGIEYTVLIDYMEHPDSNDSFLDPGYSGLSFFFAVSAVGETVDGLRRLESEKVEFGQWP